MTYLVAVPAYGRDYTSAKAVRADWDAGKDFRCMPQGAYINKQDAAQAGITVNLRFHRLTKVVVIKP